MPPRRRAQQAPAAARPRGRGMLRLLPEFPLDILFEVFSRLDPPDLIHLSRTTKALRNVLMSRTAITIWRAALANDPDLPPCPTDLNEPQYVNLAFSEHCHYCFAAGVHSILWSFRVRCCAACLPNYFGSLTVVLAKLPDNAITHHPTTVLYATAQNQLVCSFTETAALNQKLHELQNDELSLQHFVMERLKTTVVLRAHATKCENSVHRREVRRLSELQEARARQKEVILQRLRDHGYSEEIDFLNDIDPRILSEHTTIKSVKQLSDRVWSNILPALLEFMEQAREKKLRKKRKSILRKRLHIVVDVLNRHVQAHPTDIFPNAADICIMPEVKVILEDPSLDAYATVKSFENFAEQLPRLCDEWLKSKNRELLALLPQDEDAVVKTMESIDEFFRLTLATTFFKCSECIEPISYPRILAHGCMTTLRHGYRNREDDMALLFKSLNSEAWNLDGGRISYFKAAEISTKSVLECFDQDSSVTTADDLDDEGRWLECIRCNYRAKGRAVFKWKNAMLHNMNHTVSENISAIWKVLDDDDADIARKQEATIYAVHPSDSADFVCVQCNQSLPRRSLDFHLRYNHNIQEIKDEHYRLAVDASIQPPFSVTIPNKAPVIIDMTQDDDDDGAAIGGVSYDLEYIDEPEYITIADD